MKRAVFVVPGNLDTPTGGYAYDKSIIHELRALGWQIDILDLGETFPFPDAVTCERAADIFAGIAPGSVVVIDGLAYGVLAEVGERLSRSCRIIALVHHPLALEAGLTEEQVRSLRLSETMALRHANAIVVTSEPTKSILVDQYDVDQSRIDVVLPGVDRQARVSRDKTTRDDVHILSVGSLVARKGYDLLITALAGLKGLPWRLVIAGDMTRDRRVAEQLQADILRHGLADRITLAGAVPGEHLHALYADADVFALASRFEGYGMVFTEAMAAGLPVVVTDVGAARDVVGPAGAIVPPGDVDALRSALGEVIGSNDKRKAMAMAAADQAARLPHWRASGEQFAQILERLI